MITLQTWADLAELLDLMHELIAEQGMTDDEAFGAACAELPALLELGTDARFRPARIVFFDASGAPGPVFADG